MLLSHKPQNHIIMFVSNFRIKLLSVLILISFAATSYSQDVNRVSLGDYEREINRKVLHIPDIPGYVTLKGDFHMHTMMSDGHVWPEYRIREAWKEGLDVIAITDHIEYLPHKDYLKSDHNSAFEIAKSRAEEMNILLVRGSEITRSMPPGHLNAIFLEDSNPLEKEEPMDAIKAAADQGAFIFWNHPGWASQQPDTTIWWDIHTTLLENGWLHGVEVINGGEWYPVAMNWCKDKNLTVMANSDVHDAMDYKYDFSLPNSHRPMTLVFSNDRSLDGIKEALFSHRTVGFTGTQLMGAEDLIIGLFTESVKIHPPYHTTERRGRSTVYRELENISDLTFVLEKADGNGSSRKIELKPHSMTILTIADGDEMQYKLVNCWTGSSDHPVIQFE
jgi:3',5'-nucleoside bisphosphate phosphatase